MCCCSEIERAAALAADIAARKTWPRGDASAATGFDLAAVDAVVVAARRDLIGVADRIGRFVAAVAAADGRGSGACWRHYCRRLCMSWRCSCCYRHRRWSTFRHQCLRRRNIRRRPRCC